MREYDYRSPMRADGSFSMFLVLVTPGHGLTAGSLIDVSERTALRDKRDLVISPRQRGQLNGLSAIREYWKYTLSSRLKVHGFFYAASTDGGLVSITSMDAEPHQTASLALTEAAALTVRPLAATESVSNADVMEEASADGQPPEVQSQGYALRLPPGFLPDAIPVSQDSLSGVFWPKPTAPGASAPVFLLSTKHLKPSAIVANAPLQVALGMIVGMVHDLQNPITSSPQNVQIGGWSAVRLTWQGTKTLVGKSVLMHGFSYSLLDGSTLVMLIGMDGDPDAETQLPLMEAAALTLHKP